MNSEQLLPYSLVEANGATPEHVFQNNVPLLIDGQGTYTAALAESVLPRFDFLFERASLASRKDVKSLALQGDEQALRRTENSQLVTAAYVLSCIQLLHEEKPLVQSPYIAGKSLGLNIAAFEAGVFGPPQAPETLDLFFRFIHLRSQYMQRDCDARATTLANIVVSSPEDWPAAEELQQKYATETTFYLNDRSRRIGGETDKIQAFIEEAKSKGIRAKILSAVNGAFHTSHFQESRALLEDLLNDMPFFEPTVPLVSNTAPIRPLKSAREIKEEMARILTEPVHEAGMMQFLTQQGFSQMYRVGQQKPYLLQNSNGHAV